MKKASDYAIFAVLLGLLLAWPLIDAQINKRFFGGSNAPATNEVAAVEEDLSGPSTVSTPTELRSADATTEVAESTPVEAAEPEAVEPAGPETTAEVATDRIRLTFSSRGASLLDVTLASYRSGLPMDSAPVSIGFGDRRAMAYRGIPGLTERNDFSVEAARSGDSVRFERVTEAGLKLERVVQVTTNYLLEVTDTFKNLGSTSLALPTHSIQTGAMRNEPGHRNQVGFVTLGVDTWSPAEGVRNLGGKIPALFKVEREDRGTASFPVSIERTPEEVPVDWVAAKNKYFVQILTPTQPEGGGLYASIAATRALDPREVDNPGFIAKKMTPLEAVAASMSFEGVEIAPGESFVRKFQYYVGPKKYDELHAIGLHQIDVMELGNWLRPIATVLLKTMNFIHAHLWPHNYGVAIMLLTIIIRMVFWPITHKSTESMKRMMEVQPLIKAIQEKHKDNPQKMQAEVMAVYKEHKINPLGGCLPMLIQIPIFISLFYVLRSAIELRYASFLWINDLSEPENLLAGVLPIPLNILPLLMAGTMYIQQKLTPSGGDPAQAKMMRILMPTMMLFFLYNYASGLALYWTTQNLIMIVQQLTTMRRQKNKAALAAAKA